MKMFRNPFWGKRWIVSLGAVVCALGILAAVRFVHWRAEKRFQDDISVYLRKYSVLVDEAIDLYLADDITIARFQNRSVEMANDALILKRDVASVRTSSKRAEEIRELFLASLDEMSNFLESGNEALSALIYFETSTDIFEMRCSSWIWNKSERLEAFDDVVSAGERTIELCHYWKTTSDSWRNKHDKLRSLVSGFEEIPSSRGLKLRDEVLQFADYYDHIDDWRSNMSVLRNALENY